MNKGIDDIVLLCNTVKSMKQILFNNYINLHIINLSLHIFYPINIPINYINEFAAPNDLGNCLIFSNKGHIIHVG